MNIPMWHQYQLVHMYCNEVTTNGNMPVPILLHLPTVGALVDDAVDSIQVSIVLTGGIT